MRHINKITLEQYKTMTIFLADNILVGVLKRRDNNNCVSYEKS